MRGFTGRRSLTTRQTRSPMHWASGNQLSRRLTYTAGTFDSIKYMLMCAAMGAGCAWMGFLQWKSGEEISEVAGGGAIAFVIAIVVLGFRR